LVGDIEKLIKRKIEIEPIELDDEPPRRAPRERRERDADDRAGRGSSPYARGVPSSAPRVPNDPLFDQPYEPSSSAEPQREADAARTPAPRGISPNIKPKRKVAALFGAKLPEAVDS